MTRVDPRLFIHQPRIDFESITIKNEQLKKEMVAFLFEKDLLDHLGTKAYDPSANFEKYYSGFGPLYRLIDMNNDSIPELVFNGFITNNDDREFLEIFSTKKGEVQSIFREIGHLLAFKIQPNTKEILLYHHQYPCCINASHNLNRLRLVASKITQLKHYFLGRDTDMVGPFFPSKSEFKSNWQQLEEKTALYWSPAIVEKNAWFQRSEHNRIAYYDSLSVYTVLAKKGKWNFVLMKSAPNNEENRVINPANFSSISIYGWINMKN